MENKAPTILSGAVAVDDRGTVRFVNDFDLSTMRRCYLVDNFSTDTVRAFHGHLREAKCVYVISGSAIVAAVEMNDARSPSKKNKVHRFVLSAQKPSILYIPPGYANGFKPLESNTKIMFFSSTGLKESEGDDYRFPADYWGDAVWEVENR